MYALRIPAAESHFGSCSQHTSLSQLKPRAPAKRALTQPSDPCRFRGFRGFNGLSLVGGSGWYKRAHPANPLFDSLTFKALPGHHNYFRDSGSMGCVKWKSRARKLQRYASLLCIASSYGVPTSLELHTRDRKHLHRISFLTRELQFRAV